MPAGAGGGFPAAASSTARRSSCSCARKSPGHPRLPRPHAPGVKVVHPDPLTSGGANWAIVAEYGAGARGAGRSRAGTSCSWGLEERRRAGGFGPRRPHPVRERLRRRAHHLRAGAALKTSRAGSSNADIVYPRRTISREHTLVAIEKRPRRTTASLVDAFVAVPLERTRAAHLRGVRFPQRVRRVERANRASVRSQDPFRSPIRRLEASQEGDRRRGLEGASAKELGK